MFDLCFQEDEYIRELIRKAEMLWKVTLSDGSVVWSDSNRYARDESFTELDENGNKINVTKRVEPYDKKPWIRLKKYCMEKNLTVTKVQVIVIGAPEEVIWEDPNGADGIFVKRGFSRSQDMETGHSQAYQNLIVGVLNEECDAIDVNMYSWPFNAFEECNQKRIPTAENVNDMLFKKGSEKWEKVKNLLETELNPQTESEG